MSDAFEAAVDAVVSGDLDTLRRLLTPALVRGRSQREHHATLLHYVSANGVENARQRTPANAVEVATLLLDAGAEVDALADVYGGQHTTLSLLITSTPPAEAGLQVPLARLLLDRGAAVKGSDVLLALAFSFPAAAELLAERGAPLDFAAHAGLGHVDDVRRLLTTADAAQRHIALALASQLGHAEIVRLLLDAGEDPNRFNPAGYHPHSTPLHQAVWFRRDDVARLLIERGAREDVRDTIHGGTPREWAAYRDR